MSKKRLYVDVHCLQTVPPSCVNRDDTGSPKTCVYGGTQRARVSSQAWKRVIRKELKELLSDKDVGKRTRKIVGMVKDQILVLNPEIDELKAEKMAETALKNAGLKIKNAEVGTDALMLMSQMQAQALAQLIVNDEKDKKVYKAALASNPSADMALFGRMVASDPSLNYDAASQVAHAISTHATNIEYDYFTAVDDLAPEDNAGAGHIGVSEFNSSTLYRYATVNVLELYQSLGDETPEVVKAFVEAFLKTMPTGKQNSYANRTLPCSVYIAVREDQPVSFAGAFEKAVYPSENGFEEASEKKLRDYAKQTYDQFVDDPYAAFVTGDGLDELEKSVSLKTALTQLEETVSSLLKAGDE